MVRFYENMQAKLSNWLWSLTACLSAVWHTAVQGQCGVCAGKPMAPPERGTWSFCVAASCSYCQVIIIFTWGNQLRNCNSAKNRRVPMSRLNTCCWFSLSCHLSIGKIMNENNFYDVVTCLSQLLHRGPDQSKTSDGLISFQILANTKSIK